MSTSPAVRLSNGIPFIVAKLRNYFPEVDRVADGAKPITLEVTARDCAGGDRRRASTCAMARACRRDLGVDGVLIWRSTAWLVRGNLATKYMVPASLAREIVVFDRGGDFLPGTYALSAVPKSASLEDRARERKRPKSTTHERTRKPHAVYHRTANVRVSALKEAE